LCCKLACFALLLPWALVQDGHFEIYSQTGPDAGRAALLWFEQLRAAFEQIGLTSNRPARVIGFRSVADYQPYRLRPIADAYYVGTETRDYIVMPSLGPDRFGMAAHEYAHALLRARGDKLPAWLNEGLAEFFSTVRIGPRGCELGGDFPMRSQTLLHHSWMPLEQLFAWSLDSPQTRDQAALFYAQSWALTQMLVLSPDRFQTLLHALHSGLPSAQAVTQTYGKSLDAITHDLHALVDSHKFPTLSFSAVEQNRDREGAASAVAPDAVIADLLSASGDLARSEQIYLHLRQQSPNNPDIPAALGAIALRRGDTTSARAYWKQAIHDGVRDANLCYHYAVLAEQAGLGADEIRPALKRAISLNPALDDARYELALLESNAGEYAAAVANLHAMHTIAPARAYGYWSALAYALTELNQRDEAQNAADKAMPYAKTADERSHVSELKYVAKTDLTVQLTHDANGQTRMVMTRIPHGATDWNPFVEPGDRMESVEGQLKTIGCSGSRVTQIAVQAGKAILRLAVPDATRVLMRDAPPQFICGEQTPRTVVVHYASADKPGSQDNGILREMDFR
jgi:tetratricopeptide (TPR) repeat protein